MKLTISKKRRNVILVAIGILVILHLSLPFILVRYVNKTLDEIPGYKGSVDWIHVNLFRGAYQIHSLEILIDAETSYEPFFSAETIDLSLEWSAIFDGSIVGEIIITDPELIFISPKTSENKKSSDSPSGQTGENVDWTKPIKELIPLQINRFQIVNGSAHYKDQHSKPKVDVYITNLDGLATNLSNAETSSKDLPSKLNITGNSIGNGELNIEGYLNVLLPTPNFDIDLSFEKVDMTALNDFAKAYANIDFARGTLNFYGEFGGKEGQFEGYIKPLIEDLKLVDFDQDKKQPLKLIWESVVGTLAEIFENQEEDQFATKIPLKGNYENINSSIWPAIGSVLENAFIEAFKNTTDGTINLKEDKDEE